MSILKKLFSRKTKGSGAKGDDPGYLACPVVAAELKRGKLDPLTGSDREKKKPGGEDTSASPRDEQT